MDTFTIREAAKACETSYQSLRKRVDRGTVRTVKKDGIRLIPKSELERAGLWPGSAPAASTSTEIDTLRRQLAAANAELDTLRPLPAQLDAERQAREIAEDALHEQRAAAVTATAQLQEAEAGRQAAEAGRQAAEAQSAETAARLDPLTDEKMLGAIKAFRNLRRERRHALRPATAA